VKSYQLPWLTLMELIFLENGPYSNWIIDRSAKKENFTIEDVWAIFVICL
jgi:hypothetical protein